MITTDITQILREIASGTKTSLRDPWSKNWCNDAADEIERLRAKVKDLENQIDDMYFEQAGEDA